MSPAAVKRATSNVGGVGGESPKRLNVGDVVTRCDTLDQNVVEHWFDGYSKLYIHDLRVFLEFELALVLLGSFNTLKRM